MSSVWATVSSKFLSVSRKKFVRYGLPFFVMIIGGSYGLKEFAQLRYTFSTQQKLTRQEMKDLGLDVKAPEEVTLEAVYEQTQKMDIDTWHNIRGPRPWEEPSPELEAMRTKKQV